MPLSHPAIIGRFAPSLRRESPALQTLSTAHVGGQHLRVMKQLLTAAFEHDPAGSACEPGADDVVGLLAGQAVTLESG
jgi:hypothetical protein